MRMELRRRRLTEYATFGDLLVDGEYECHTLEDVVRPDPNPETPQNEGKVWGATAIPAGQYAVIVNHSPRFGRLYPRLVGVPGFDGILIHKGNRSEDTHGCILVGRKIGGDDLIQESTLAFDALFPRILKAHQENVPITITISDEFDGGPHETPRPAPAAD